MPPSSTDMCPVTASPTLGITEGRPPMEEMGGVVEMAAMLRRERILGKPIHTVGMVAMPTAAMVALPPAVPAARPTATMVAVLKAALAALRTAAPIRGIPPTELLIGRLVREPVAMVGQEEPVGLAGRAEPRRAEPRPRLPLAEPVQRAVEEGTRSAEVQEPSMPLTPSPD